MNIAEIKHYGDVEAIKLGFGPIGPPLMSVYLYFLDGILIDTGQRHMQKPLIQLLDGKKLQFLEDFVGQVQHLKEMGLSQEAALKQMDPGQDKFFKLVTVGNISFANMLKSAYDSDRV